MKKSLLLCVFVFLVGILCSCGAESDPQDSTSAQTPAISIEEYESMVSNFNASVLDESIILSNVGQYEYNYWKAFSGLPTYGDLDYAVMVEKAMDWLSEESDYNADTVSAAYDEICAAYSDIVRANVTGDIPEEISNNVNDLFNAYNGLYLLVTDPSGDIASFAEYFNDFSHSITSCNSTLSAILPE